MRTFIAIEFPAAAHEQLQTLSDQLRAYLHMQRVPDCLRWSALANLHLTLRFLGETTPAQTPRIATGLREVTADHTAFALTLGGVGGFPNLRQPRLVWLGVGGNLRQLNALQAAVEQATQLAGFAAETQPFSAHITLARVGRNATKAQRQTLGHQLGAYCATQQIPLYVDAVVHMRSERQPTGAVYTPLARFPLQSELV